MLKMTEKSKAFLEKNLPNVVENDSLEEVLDPLYDLIMYKGFKKGWEGYNAFGIEAQAVYDDLYYSNT